MSAIPQADGDSGNLGATPAYLVAPEGAFEHAGNAMQILVDCLPNERGNYEITPMQMAGVLSRLRAIRQGER